MTQKSSKTKPDHEPEKRHVFDDPKNVKRVIYGLFAVCAVAMLAAPVVIATSSKNE